MKYKIALLIGRFQPFHKGHLYLLKEALKAADKIVVGIGSSNITDVNNPIDYETRSKIIKAVAYKEKIEDKILKIVPLDDYFNDTKWLSNVKKMVGKFDLVVGQNDWVNGIMKKAGIKVLTCPYYRRDIYEGWKIRKLISLMDCNWKNRIPSYLISNIKDQISKTHIKNQKFKHVVIGGTFDRLHIGHKALIDKAFKVGKKITIGLATEELYKNKALSSSVESYATRKKNLHDYLDRDRKNVNYEIISFSDIYGPTLTEKNIDAIVVSRETLPNALKINEGRKKINFKPLHVIVIEDVLATDGKIISSERIRLGEISREGKKYQISNIKHQKEIIMPEDLRPILQKPLGKVYRDVRKVIKSIKSIKPVMVIAVGDIIVDSLLKNGVEPDIKVIDFHSRRKPIDVILRGKPEGSPTNVGKSEINSEILREVYSAFGGAQNDKKNVNKPGTINIETAEKIGELVHFVILRQAQGDKPAMMSLTNRNEKSWLIIDGEEDLLALPAILFAPLGSLVLYGHWEYGIIAVEVDEDVKEKVEKILKKFE